MLEMRLVNLEKSLVLQKWSARLLVCLLLNSENISNRCILCFPTSRTYIRCSSWCQVIKKSEIFIWALCLEKHEHHKAKSEGEDSGRHKLEGKIAGGLGVGAVGYALHEHHEKKKEKKEMEELEKHGHEKHGWFSWLSIHVIGPTYLPCIYNVLKLLLWEIQSCYERFKSDCNESIYFKFRPASSVHVTSKRRLDWVLLYRHSQDWEESFQFEHPFRVQFLPICCDSSSSKCLTKK